jgi:hypothetical protein
VSGASSSVPETAGLVEEQQSRPALLLVVSSGHELPAGGDARVSGSSGVSPRVACRPLLVLVVPGV